MTYQSAQHLWCNHAGHQTHEIIQTPASQRNYVIAAPLSGLIVWSVNRMRLLLLSHGRGRSAFLLTAVEYFWVGTCK